MASPEPSEAMLTTFQEVDMSGLIKMRKDPRVAGQEGQKGGFLNRPWIAPDCIDAMPAASIGRSGNLLVE